MLILILTPTHLDKYTSNCICICYSPPTTNHTINSVTLRVLGKFRNRKNLEISLFAMCFFLYTNFLNLLASNILSNS